MTLRADVGVRVDAFALDVALGLDPGEVVAVLGPNGAGKSTLLRCLSGLVPLDRGRIEVDGRVLDDPQRGTFVPAERRPVGVVFQDYLLFPNLSVMENVAFGLRARGTPRAEARAQALTWLDRVGLADHAGRRPRTLSGGQAQRVALARALATRPRLLLLDEPLAALDAATRAEVRRDLRRHLDAVDGMRLIVTHDPVDAHALADRVIVLESGRVVQSGTLGEVTAHPRSTYVAELVGTNLLRGNLLDAVLTTADGATVVTAGNVPDGPALASVRPQAVALHRREPEGSPRNSWRCTVVGVDRATDRVRVSLAGPVSLVAEITPAALIALGLQPGDEVWAAVKASEITGYAC